MSKRKTVYVVASGEYSDYGVLCACPSRADAETLASRMNAAGDRYGSECFVEELPVLSGDAQRVDILQMHATVWDDGTVTDEQMWHRIEWPLDLYAAPVAWRWVRAPMHKGKGGRLEVSGIDHERVRKVYGDRRAVLLTDDAMRARREATGGAS